jgi:chromosome segregation ATPase
MSDLVERLREYAADDEYTRPDGTRGNSAGGDAWREAADEIERLQAERDELDRTVRLLSTVQTKLKAEVEALHALLEQAYSNLIDARDACNKRVDDAIPAENLGTRIDKTVARIAALRGKGQR